MWTPDAGIIQLACESKVKYTDGARVTIAGVNQQLPLRHETVELRNMIVNRFGVKQTYMPGRSRYMNIGDRRDLHQSGRAIDFMVNPGRVDCAAIANHLLSYVDFYGIQFIVWDHMRFSAAKVGSARFAVYTGSNPHTDHIHAELCAEASEAPFYNRDGL